MCLKICISIRSTLCSKFSSTWKDPISSLSSSSSFLFLLVPLFLFLLLLFLFLFLSLLLFPPPAADAAAASPGTRLADGLITLGQNESFFPRELIASPRLFWWICQLPPFVTGGKHCCPSVCLPMLFLRISNVICMRGLVDISPFRSKIHLCMPCIRYFPSSSSLQFLEETLCLLGFSLKSKLILTSYSPSSTCHPLVLACPRGSLLLFPIHDHFAAPGSKYDQTGQENFKSTRKCFFSSQDVLSLSRSFSRETSGTRYQHLASLHKRFPTKTFASDAEFIFSFFLVMNIFFKNYVDISNIFTNIFGQLVFVDLKVCFWHGNGLRL